MITGRFRRSRPAAVAAAVVVSGLVAAAVALGLAASGCESCQPSSRYYNRQIEHELRTQLCARGSYYLECASAHVYRDPASGASTYRLSSESCQDLVSTLMGMCGDIDRAPTPTA